MDGGHYDFSGGNENFFVGESDLLTREDRCVGGFKSNDTGRQRKLRAASSGN